MKRSLYYEISSLLLLLVLQTCSRGVICSSMKRMGARDNWGGSSSYPDKTPTTNASTTSEYSDINIEKGIQQLHQDQLNTQERVSTLADEVKDIKGYLRELLPTDCYAAKLRGRWTNKTLVSPPGLVPRYVLCDQHTSGGGWTVVLHRQPGKPNRENFTRSWDTYKSYFGSLKGEFWIGLDVLHALTAETPYEVLIKFIDTNRHRKQAVWKTFRVGPESDNYRLTIRDYQSGDSQIYDAMKHHNGKPFSTFDMDNTNYIHSHCGHKYGGGWWYGKCHHALLTGDPSQADHAMKGIRWKKADNTREWLELTHATMMIKPKLPH